MHALLATLLFAIASVKAGPHTITMKVPAGWRQFQAAELKGGRPVVLAMKRDIADKFAPKAEIVSSQMPEAMRSMPLLTTARSIAATMFAALGPGAKYDIEPRATNVGGLPAVEWVVRFNLRDQAMISRMIVIADGPTMDLITYAAPAAATADFQAFNDAVKSLTIK